MSTRLKASRATDWRLSVSLFNNAREISIVDDVTGALLARDRVISTTSINELIVKTINSIGVPKVVRTDYKDFARKKFHDLLWDLGVEHHAELPQSMTRFHRKIHPG
jgi:hypothetical protein